VDEIEIASEICCDGKMPRVVFRHLKLRMKTGNGDPGGLRKKLQARAKA